MSKTIFLASDHGGFELKNHIAQHLAQSGHSYQDLGTDSDTSVDYPDFAQVLVKEIQQDPDAVGVLVCGTGIGISMKANRNKGIRAAVVYDTFTAEMAKAHNNANVLCLGGRTTAPELACELIDLWLNTEFEGGRHQNRLDKLDI